MSEKEIIEKLILKYNEMRAAQNNYFKHRGDVWLKISKGKEANLDEFVQHIQRMGYNPENQKQQEPKQENLF